MLDNLLNPSPAGAILSARIFAIVHAGLAILCLFSGFADRPIVFYTSYLGMCALTVIGGVHLAKITPRAFGGGRQSGHLAWLLYLLLLVWGFFDPDGGRGIGLWFWGMVLPPLSYLLLASKIRAMGQEP